jgi:hypothetical protein
MITIVFSFDTEYGNFCDALHLEDNHAFSDQEIEAMKQERLANWIAVLTSPSPTEDPPTEG